MCDSMAENIICWLLLTHITHTRTRCAWPTGREACPVCVTHGYAEVDSQILN
jgi:hypothetical protein